MKDCELVTEYESEPRVYGNYKLTENENEALRLPPKFAVYRKIEPNDCKAEIEKYFTKLRWKRHIEQSRNNDVESDTVDDTRGDFYSSETNDFDLSR